MKTTRLIILSLLFFFTLGTNAQHHFDRHHQRNIPKMTPEQMVKRMVDRLKIELKLNAQQEKQVTVLFSKNFQKRGDIWKKYQGQRDSIFFYNKKLNQTQDSVLSKILTKEQYKTYQLNQEKRKKEWEQRRQENNYPNSRNCHPRYHHCRYNCE